MDWCVGVDCGACLCVCVVLRSGGCELLFNKQKEHDIDTPESVVTMKDLIAHVRDHMLAERPDLFVSGDTVYVLDGCAVLTLWWWLGLGSPREPHPVLP